jgi:hypothetical protein
MFVFMLISKVMRKYICNVCGFMAQQRSSLSLHVFKADATAAWGIAHGVLLTTYESISNQIISGNKNDEKL